jgi:polyribonucleotide nucleotidyltransferase
LFKIIKKSIEWGGCALSLETGKIARQPHGSVVVNYGGTSVLVTVVHKKK